MFVLKQKDTRKFLQIAFRFVLFAIMVYLIFKQVDRYLANECAPSFAYKRFLDDPKKDIYPVFTFCIEESGQIYDEEYLNSYGFTGIEYKDYLSGEKTDKLNETQAKKIDYDKAVIKLDDIVSNFKIIAQDSNGMMQKILWKEVEEEPEPEPEETYPEEGLTDEKGMPILPLYKSYQDPKRLCFSRFNNYGPQGIRAHEYVSLNRTLLTSMKGKFRVYHHQTHQKLKRECKHIISKDISYIDFGFLEFWISQVNVIRWRVDGNIPCVPGLNDDQTLIETIMKKVNCTPPYWKTMIPKERILPSCGSSTQLKAINDVFKTPDKLMSIFTQYTPPCDRVSSIVTFHEKPRNPDNDDNILLLVFNHQEEMYQEVTNKRDFDMEMMWSCVGGFIGMFLGYSLWQCPDMVMGCQFKNRMKYWSGVGKGEQKEKVGMGTGKEKLKKVLKKKKNIETVFDAVFENTI